jgi:uncharacterized protein YjiK
MNRVLYCSLLSCLLLAAVGFSSCQLLWSPNTPKNYVLPRPRKMILDKKLNEVSGLFYLKNENAMIAVSDNKQKIYRITQDGNVNHYFNDDIGPQEDYEDLVKVDSTIYVLISNGTIVAVTPSDSGLLVNKYPFWSTDKNDFETLYYDPESKGLVILCKNCDVEKGKNIRTAYRFDLAGKQFDTKPYYTISSKAVKNSLKDGKIDFEPSAAAIHPLEKQLYILASAGNLLVITDLKGTVRNVYRLNPTLYPQAEGIAFAPNGDLYVTNEAKLGKPTLLHIPYKPSGK